MKSFLSILIALLLTIITWLLMLWIFPHLAEGLIPGWHTVILPSGYYWALVPWYYLSFSIG